MFIHRHIETYSERWIGAWEAYGSQILANNSPFDCFLGLLCFWDWIMKVETIFKLNNVISCARETGTLKQSVQCVKQTNKKGGLVHSECNVVAASRGSTIRILIWRERVVIVSSPIVTPLPTPCVLNYQLRTPLTFFLFYFHYVLYFPP